jgi:hypothetical protein
MFSEGSVLRILASEWGNAGCLNGKLGQDPNPFLRARKGSKDLHNLRRALTSPKSISIPGPEESLL